MGSRGGLFVCVVLLVSLGLASSSDAEEDHYLIIEGPGLGVLLDTQSGEFTVSKYLFQAEGDIGGAAGDHCNGALHYHGTLFARPDPDPRACGWGRVTLVKSVNDDLCHITKAIEAERVAQLELGEQPPNYGSAARCQYLLVREHTIRREVS